ncbi:MAG: DUF3667 domain-containing protein [Chitinophaga sp.]|uniref:DUF3667 domain-containing protein n=1 Tax=Chitinophaga sp. TaxID=1869181 RepID=UPI001B1B7851|nr:DUF3667 domain-containing protein [Chitinophaga sp.]MBO9727226.1 DUF3667 domain-containing protein [Chitinophaga sp.]
MKTQPLREDKHCLNCGTEVPERFCTHCGQENTVPHETFGHLFKHFVADIFHYDSQFLMTLKSLLFRPGFLSREYMAGRRVRYVNPIKLYVFVSFVFFFGVFALHSSHPEEEEPETAETRSDNAATKAEGDTIRNLTLNEGLDQAFAGDSSAKTKKIKRLAEDAGNFSSVKAFDSAQAKLPESERYHGASRLFFRRIAEIRHKYGKNIQAAIVEIFMHNLPKLMFLMLPLFALFMKWLYDKKRWLYADHAIFAIHFHSFAFIVLLVGFLWEAIFHSDLFMTIAYWLIFLYLIRALMNNYSQGFFKSFWKAVGLLTAYFAAAVFVFLGFLFLIFSIFL